MSNFEIRDPGLLVASCTCDAPQTEACCAPFYTNPDGTALVTTPGSPIPIALVYSQRLTAATWPVAPTPEPV